MRILNYSEAHVDEKISIKFKVKKTKLIIKYIPKYSARNIIQRNL